MGDRVQRDGRNERAQVMLSMAMWMVLAVAPVQAVIGDMHGINTLEHQPQKVAAMEGNWDTRRGVPLILFGWPDAAREETRFALEIPRLGSIILRHSLDGEVPGLKQFPRDQRPTNVPLVFWAFRVMVGLSLLMIALSITGFVMRRRGRLYDHSRFLRAALAMGPGGLVAVTAGWIVTETGRQPFTVYGLLRTADNVSPVAVPAVATSLAAFAVVYFVVLGAGIWFLFRLFSQTPRQSEPGLQLGQPVRTAIVVSGLARQIYRAHPWVISR